MWIRVLSVNTGIEQLLAWLLACTWGSNSHLLLLSDSSGIIGVLTLLVLLIGFPILRWYIRRDNQDLVI
jgi:hypothetical protein